MLRENLSSRANSCASWRIHPNDCLMALRVQSLHLVYDCRVEALNTTVIKFEPEISLPQSCLDCFLELKGVGEIYVFSSHQVVLETADVISAGKHILVEKQTMIDREEFRTLVLLWRKKMHFFTVLKPLKAMRPFLAWPSSKSRMVTVGTRVVDSTLKLEARPWCYLWSHRHASGTLYRLLSV